MDNSSAPRRVAHVYAAAAVTVALWAGTPIANKIAVATIDSATAGLLRSALAGVIAAVLALLWRLPFPRGAGERFLLAFSGIANFGLWPLLLSFGLGLTTASHAALLIAMIPLVTGLLASAVDRRWPTGGWWAGVALATAGTVLLVSYRGLTPEAAIGADAVIGDLLILLGVVACSIGYVAGGKLAPVIGTWATTFWGLGLAAVVLLPVIALLAGRTDWSVVGTAEWLSVGYMTVFSSLIGYIAWFWALGHGGIARISAWQLGQPVLTMGAAVPLLGERLSLPLIAAAIIILAGTALTQVRPAAAT
jgi:drug/metabolite transporter (DMT)-like permease